MYSQVSVFSFYASFFSYISSEEREHRNNVNPSYNWKKFNNKMNEKRSQEYQSMDPEYVTEQINSHILELLLDDFVVWFFHCLENLNML